MGRIRRVQGTARCEVCGNSAGKCFEVHLGGEKHVFDSFECAMRAFRLHCVNCGCEIVGHGVQAGNRVFCSQQCAAEDSAREYARRTALRGQSNY